MIKSVATFCFVLLGVVSAQAQTMPMSLPVNAKSLKWGSAPPVFPKGAQIAIVSGDPFKVGPFVVRIKVPKGYKLPAHNHPTAEYITVISGRFHMGTGDKIDLKRGFELRQGGFGEVPAKMNHYAWATAETIVQVHGQGPFALTYVNPEDDPSKKQ